MIDINMDEKLVRYRDMSRQELEALVEVGALHTVGRGHVASGTWKFEQVTEDILPLKKEPLL